MEENFRFWPEGPLEGLHFRIERLRTPFEYACACEEGGFSAIVNRAVEGLIQEDQDAES